MGDECHTGSGTFWPASLVPKLVHELLYTCSGSRSSSSVLRSSACDGDAVTTAPHTLHT